MTSVIDKNSMDKEFQLKRAAYVKKLLGPAWLPASLNAMPGYAPDDGVSLARIDAEALQALLKISKGDAINIAAIVSVAMRLLICKYMPADYPLSLGLSLADANKNTACLLLLNAAPGADEKVSDLIVAHRRAILDGMAQRFASFSEIGQHLPQEGARQLFGVHLALQHNAVELFQPDTIQIELADLAQGGQLTFRANGLPFPETYRLSILENLCHWIQQVCLHPAAQVGALSPISTPSQDHVMAFAHGPACPFIEDQRLEQMLEHWAQETPERVAAVEQNGAVSYRELNRQANRVAHQLIARGVRAGDVVAVMVPRSVAMLAAIYGVLKAGATYVPIDPNYPVNRRNYILSDSAARVLLLNSEVAHVEGGNLICLDVGACLEQEGNEANPAGDNSATDVAYLIYTSGSTGNPKGVMIEHRSAFNRIEWMQNAFGLQADDVILQKTPISFDVSVWELFWWAHAGASVCLLAPGAEKEPDLILAALLKYQVTHMHFVPSMLDAFLNHLETDPEPVRAAHLRAVFTSGEALTLHQSERFIAMVGQRQGSRLINLYGPTEATVDVTWYECVARDGRASIPIGRPIQNTQIYVLDEQGRPTPMGVAGELCIGGVNLARGYLNRAELTAEKFRQLPLPEMRRVYSSGDLVRWLADGNIEYLGRIDHQVKIRGYRIELGEIETVLMRCPGINDVRVIALSRDDGSRYLAAYAVVKDDYRESAVREELLANLPEFMVPPFIVTLPSFPLTPNGKLDRAQLPNPYQLLGTTEKRQPANPVEQMLAGIWSEVLGVQDIGTEDNFFSLGGDSISFLGIISRAKKQGFEISFQELFKYPTISQLAPCVRTAVASAEAAYQTFSLLSPADRASLPDGLQDAYPMTALQAGLIFQSELQRGASWYHDIQSYTLNGQFNGAAFEQAMQWMMAEHPILRTSYQLQQHEVFVQYVHQSCPLPLFVSDWRQMAPAQQATQLEAFFEYESHYKFNWQEPGLIRIHIHVLSDQQFRYLLSFHDSALDGWSINLFHTKLLRYYNMAQQNRSPDGEFRDDFLRRYLALELAARSGTDSRAYWETALHGFEAMTIPRPAREKRGVPVVEYFDVEIEPALSQAVRALASALAVPVKTILLACHLRVLGFITNKRRIVTGYEHSGRPEEMHAEQSIGLFLNTIPYQLELAPGEDWRALIARVHAREAEFLPHRRFPMADMKILLNTTEVLFESVFNFTHFHLLKELKTLPGMEELAVRVRAETEFPLRAEFGQDAYTDEVHLSLHYYSNEFELGHIARLGQYYKATLEHLVAAPDTGYLAHSLLARTELEALEELGRGPERTPPQHTPIAQVARHSLQHGDAIALQDECRSLSYAGLQQEAARLAAQFPPGRQRVVGVALPRSVDWIVAMYAVMANADIYLPLDPALPDARLEELIAEGDVAMVVCASHQLPRISQLARAGRRAVDVVVLSPAPATMHCDYRPELPPSLPDLAYVLFTSGSTGKPKGAQLEHAGMYNHMLSKIEELALVGADVLAQTAPVTFDVSVWQALTGLVAGARTVVYSREIQLDAASFIDRLNADGVTVLELVPSYFAIVLDYLERQAGAVRFATLRALILTGEALKQEMVNRWFALQPAIQLVNAYGPTEASDDITHCILQGPLGQNLVPVGRPIRNLRIHILNDNDQLVPLGSTGEICVSGIGVGRGYLNAPDKNAQAFDFQHPLAQWSNGRLYRTGDLGYWLEDGNLAYLGRKDEQVKLRGMRIELGEIENVLLTIGGVRDAAVVLDQSNPGHPKLVGFVQSSVEVQDVLAKLATKLPMHMVPERLLALDAFPLNRAGKVDKKALLSTAAELGDEVRAVLPLSTMQERQLAGLWADALKIDVAAIGKDSNFFSLGGNSLLAMLVAMRSEGKFTIVDIFEQRTLARLAALVERPKQRETVLRALTPDTGGMALVCFSYAGGNSVNFQAIADVLGDDGRVALYAVEPPGNDPSSGSPLVGLPELVSRCVDELRSRGIRTLIPWGHCSGTGGAVELIRQATLAGMEVAGAIVSGKLLRSAATLQDQTRQNQAMSDEEIVDWLVNATGFALGDSGQPWLVQHLARAFRNDAIEANHALQGLWQGAGPLMEKPLLCLLAEDDPLTQDHAGLVENWRRVSPLLAHRIIASGGHYFIKNSAALVAAQVLRMVQ